MKNKTVFRKLRPCKQCEQMFTPETKWVTLCLKCFKKVDRKSSRKNTEWIFTRTCKVCKKEYGSDFEFEINLVCPKCCSSKFRNRYARLRRQKC